MHIPSSHLAIIAQLFTFPFRIVAASSDNEKTLNNSNNSSIGMGRITGSASIETLGELVRDLELRSFNKLCEFSVRVGIEKEHGLSPDSKMVVLHDFTPCVDDELEVKRGQIVNVLYRENDWVYIIGQDTRQEGFIPHSYCAPYNTHLADLAIKKKLPRNSNMPVENQLSDYNEMETHQVSDIVALQNNLKHSQASLNSEPDYLPFAKDPSGRYIVLYTFIARDENDVSVERGEFVTGELVDFVKCPPMLTFLSFSSQQRRPRLVLDSEN